MDKYLVVLAGAGVGGVARFAAANAVMNRFTGRFPLGTFLVNVSGCFLIGILMTILTDHLTPHPNWRLFLVVGFLGGYTTFSSFEYETYMAMKTGGGFTALLNVLGSVVAGYIAVWLGAFLVTRRLG